MYSFFQLALKYTRYYLTAANGKGHGIHSPFVFDLVRRVLNDKRRFEAFARIEDLRKRALNNKKIIQVEDFGAGSRTNHPVSAVRSIASIALNAAKPPKLAQLLFRLANYYRPRYIIELGTSLGISTAYLASANNQALVVAAEGSMEIARLAKAHFEELHLPVTLVTGNFNDTLPEILGYFPEVDMAFLDGNHREAPTLAYFYQLLPRMSGSSMIIFDDIHWSREMESAWQKIKDHPTVMCTVDIFFMGIVFFRPHFKEKQHFTIRF